MRGNQSFIATKGNMAHSVTLNWAAPAGSVVTAYNVKRAATAAGPFVQIGTSPTTSFVDTNVVEGQTYFYDVTAVNSAGEGAPSNTANASVPFLVPGAPTNLVATAV